MENLTDMGVIKDLFSRHGFSFSKTLGQNFLINPSVCPKIAEMGGAARGVGAIEIGTGVGVLTQELAKRAERVVAIEIDERLIPILNETLAEYDNVTVINGDVMKLDLNEIIGENFGGMDVVVCANLPYYITSPIIMLLLESRLPISSVTVMVQREAGKRLCAELGTRDVGAVTVAVRYYSEPKLLFNVSRGSFMPPPNVDSCVIRLDIRRDNIYKAADEEFFFKTVRGAFSQRRKNLLNSLSSSLGMEKAMVAAAAESANISPNARPEQLSMEDFLVLAEKLALAKNEN
ncbi:MAG: 16S rRNA (adenine(1518)-N(6)/adenine(1519)-N(6))-dimethyltransferase RsmA [Oscillospiraceae bacterium]|nr:16S rRNA (adenine(1518)-N(6)/adenine(1519)-N(6))-dimethyltransferase RsmA [Oscillospiraceae bacterium]